MRHTTAILVFLTALTSSACSGSGPVGYVDINRIGRDSKAGREFAAELVDSKVDELRAVSDAAAAAYKKLVGGRDPDVAGTDAGVKEAAARATKAAQALQVEINRQQDRAAKLEDRCSVAVARVAQAHGMTMVLAQQARPPYAAPNTDLTTEVIARLDAEVAASEVAKLRGDLAAARASLAKRDDKR